MKQLQQDRQAMIEAFRAAAHEHLDRWVDQQTDLFNTEKQPTLRQMSDNFTRTRSTLLGSCLEKMVDELTATYRQQELANCPHCATPLKWQLSVLPSLPHHCLEASTDIFLFLGMLFHRKTDRCQGCLRSGGRNPWQFAPVSGGVPRENVKENVAWIATHYRQQPQPSVPCSCDWLEKVR